MRKTLFATSALLGGSWKKNVRITIEDGLVTTILPDAVSEKLDEIHQVIVPGMPNLHSHAFQRAMAGLAEVRGPSQDSFWSWRKVMYDFALSMTPEQVEAVAAQLYMEMLEAGFTRVGEFHYLHHDKTGAPYADIAEMAARIVEASIQTGIQLTLLPVFYAHSGFGGAAPSEGQRRFVNSLDSYARLLERCRALLEPLPAARLGVAPHSLRAVTPAELGEVVRMAATGPVHIHVAEQVKEVEDCLAWSGARPVEWLLSNAPVDARWCLIHATHMNEREIVAMAESGAIAGLCPITEANLGDGIFAAPAFLDNGGRYGVGSDSNIDISIAGELRQLEYSQRLSTLSRNVIADPAGSTASRLIREARHGGSTALGAKESGVVGASADFVALDVTDVPYLSADRLLDQWIFGSGVKVDSVWIGGEKRVAGGRHVRRDAIARRFQAVMADLLAA